MDSRSICLCKDDHRICHSDQSGFVLDLAAVFIIAHGQAALKRGGPGTAGCVVTLTLENLPGPFHS